MRWILKKAAVLLATYHAYMLEYRGEIFFWLLSGITPFFFMAVWMEAAGQGYTEISTDQYARYFSSSSSPDSSRWSGSAGT